MIVGPENRTAMSSDNFLRVSLVGDFVGYTSIPTFEDFYLVIPRQVYACIREIIFVHCQKIIVVNSSEVVLELKRNWHNHVNGSLCQTYKSI